MLDLFEVFDFANPNLVIGHRNTSTLPTQSLFLMNNPMVLVQSQKAATRILAADGLDEQARVELAYRQALGRRPSETERLAATEYLASFVANSGADDSTLAAWSSFCHAIFSSLDFRYIE